MLGTVSRDKSLQPGEKIFLSLTLDPELDYYSQSRFRFEGEAGGKAITHELNCKSS
jgi:hypothetical protein